MHKNLLNFPVFKPYCPTRKPTGVTFGANESTLVHPSVQHVTHVGKKLHNHHQQNKIPLNALCAVLVVMTIIIRTITTTMARQQRLFVYFTAAAAATTTTRPVYIHTPV